MHWRREIPQRPRDFRRMFFAKALRTKIWIERRMAQVFAVVFDEHPSVEQVHRARWVLAAALVRSNRERFGARRPARRN